MSGKGTAIVILAGGAATRFPGKLERSLDGEPILVRTYRNACAAGWPVYVACGSPATTGVARLLDAPLLFDRRPYGGPLHALLSACEALECARVLALAGDEPRADADLLQSLDAAWRPGDEAVVPRHDGHIEPLAALYDRPALLREGTVLIERGVASMHALVDRLKVRFVPASTSQFVNVNTPGDLRRALGTLS